MRQVTLIFVGLLAGVALGQDAPQRQATITYLHGLEAPGGGFRPAAVRDGKESPSGVRATTTGLRGLKYFGGSAKDPEACREFVKRCYDKETGAFRDNPKASGEPDVFTTAVGLLAAVELKLPAADFAEAAKFLEGGARTFEEIRIAAAAFEALGQKPAHADAWIRQVEKLRNPDGTYGKDDGIARETGSAVVTVLRLGGKAEQRDAVVRALRAGQRGDGGFGNAGAAGSDLESCYRIMRAFFMLKEKPAEPGKLREFIARCRNADGGYGIAPGQPSGIGPTYYAAIVLHWLAER